MVRPVAVPPAAAATAVLRAEGDAAVAVLGGDWRLDASPPRFPSSAPDAALANVRVLGFDSVALGEWDSSLLVFLFQAQEYCELRGAELDTTGLPQPVARMLSLARAVPERVVAADPPAVSRVDRLGNTAIAAGRAALAAAAFTGEVAEALARLVRRRGRMRWRDFWVVVQANSSGALGIVGLIALLVGVIIAFLGVVVLERFGAGYYVSYLLGYGMLREMGALMTGIIIAGRTGAAFAAELGSMKLTEEIDAYTTLGVSPVDHLVLPRVLGLFVTMPLLVLYADFVGIAGGLLVAISLLDLSPTQFMTGLLTAVTLQDAVLGLFKATVFGVIVGIAGCMKGMQSGSDAGAVGRAATAAVVLGITLIIVANAVIDWLAALLLI